ncbi:MAG: sulfite exporter TauE/SafE family protein [Undibacterium sp.]|nr:sulfite exporter TauE/SafE family protein [Undibacterium sp.]
MMMGWMALAIGVPVGLIMGITGAGGGMLALSALVLLLDWNMQQATPVALMAVTAGAYIGGIDGLRKRLVRYRAAVLMALMGAPFAIAGVQLARLLPQKWLMLSFAIVLIWVGTRLIRQKRPLLADDTDRPVLARLNPVTGRFNWTLRTTVVISAIGGMAGFMTGLLGVGGGFVIVPLLRHYTNVSMHAAVATSLLVIALVGTVGVSTALIQGVALPAEFTALFMLATIAGMLAGRRLVAHLHASTVQRLFAILLLLVALGMTIKALMA